MNHEEALIKAFIDPRRTERYLEFIANPKKRSRFTRDLGHFKALNPGVMVSIPPRQQNPQGIASLLKAKGAGAKCWIISENAELDGQEMDLGDALEEIVGRQMGTLISCVPGRLGYFEDEDGRCILERWR